MALLVSIQSVGARKPLLADFGIDPPRELSDGEDLRLRQVIEHVVRHEVAAFHRRQADARFDRILTGAQIRDGAAKGKIDPAAKTADQSVDPDDAVATALIAFEDGLFLVIIDGVEYRQLDETVRLTPTSRLTFLRLTFVAGA